MWSPAGVLESIAFLLLLFLRLMLYKAKKTELIYTHT